MGLSWIDAEGGTPITEAIHWALDDVGNPTDAQAELDTLVPLLVAVSGCRIVAARIYFDLVVPAQSAAVAGYSKNTGARLSFKDTNGVGDSMYIAGMLQSQLVNNTKFVDAGTTQMQALINKVTGQSGVDPLSSYGSGAKWASYVNGQKANRK